MWKSTVQLALTLKIRQRICNMDTDFFYDCSQNHICFPVLFFNFKNIYLSIRNISLVLFYFQKRALFVRDMLLLLLILFLALCLFVSSFKILYSTRCTVFEINIFSFSLLQNKLSRNSSIWFFYSG